jgi:hypothetical protein
VNHVTAVERHRIIACIDDRCARRFSDVRPHYARARA